MQERGWPTANYRVVAETGPDHHKLFEVEAARAGRASARGHGKTKKEAEQVAAREVIALFELRSSSEKQDVGPGTAPESASARRGNSRARVPHAHRDTEEVHHTSLREYFESLLGHDHAGALRHELRRASVQNSLAIHGTDAFGRRSSAGKQIYFRRHWRMVRKTSCRIAPIRRGDIIVFKFPFDDHPHYVKRVIGIPGDRIKIVDQQVFVNGQELKEPYVVHDPAAAL